MHGSGWLHLFWTIPLIALAVFGLAVAYATASAELRHKRYFAGGIDLVDKMTQAQFSTYLIKLFEHQGFSIHVLKQDEERGSFLLAEKSHQKRLVYAQRARHGVKDVAVAYALEMQKQCGAAELLIVTNSVLSRNKDEEVKKQNVEVWDREKLIPSMGKASARRFALQSLENDP